MTVLSAFLFIFAVCLVGVVGFGHVYWAVGTQRLRGHLRAVQLQARPLTVDFSELESLPDPVKQYFRNVLTDGQAAIATVHIRHTGQFNVGSGTDLWKPFVSEQLTTVRRPGFDWNARIAIAPGLSIRVHDAYISGEGWLQAALMGIFPLLKLNDTSTLAEGELMRFLAEAAIYPTALLPGKGLRWQPIDCHSARVTLTDGNLEVSLKVSFDKSGLIHSVRAEKRGRLVNGETIPTPWRGRFWNYHKQAGMLIPLEGEVSWVLPEGMKPYWRGRISELTYNYSQ